MSTNKTRRPRSALRALTAARKDLAAVDRRYKSPALKSLHEALADLHGCGAIDNAKMAEFDRSCLVKSNPNG